MPESEHRDAHLLSLGRAVRRIREQRGLSADELAGAAGMSHQRIDALETGRLDPTYELLLALSEVLGIPPSALVTLAEELEDSNEP